MSTPPCGPRVSPGHVLSGVRSLSLDVVTGEAEVVFADGRLVTDQIAPDSAPTTVVRATFDVEASTVRLQLTDGTTFTSEIGTVREAIDRPVVYLDQNHWIDLARVLTGSLTVDGSKREALEGLIELARSEEIILPLSSAHVVETAKKGGRQRTDVARAMVEFSRGWQMRSPLEVRAHELDRLMTDAASATVTDHPPATRGDVFTLTPRALWSDQVNRRRRRRVPDGLVEELAGLVDRISWAVSVADMLLGTDPEVSLEGVEMATRWAASFQELAQHMRSNPSAKPYLRDLTRVRTIYDMGDALPEAALRAGLTENQFSDWLRETAESALSSQPAIGRIREVFHLRLVNADDRWHANDLNDVLYLCTAAGYADFIVGEKKTSSYLQRVRPRVSTGAEVHRRVTDALPAIAAAAGSRMRRVHDAGPGGVVSET